MEVSDDRVGVPHACTVNWHDRVRHSSLRTLVRTSGLLPWGILRGLLWVESEFATEEEDSDAVVGEVAEATSG